jgi:hypothetical protein
MRTVGPEAGDAELTAAHDYWANKRWRYQQASDGHGAWWCSKQVAAIEVELRQRRSVLESPNELP